MAQKVDSLKIVSSAKPLSATSKLGKNSNIEVFTTDGIKANIDEIDLSNKNNNNQIEEKSDNKKKWLIGAGATVGTIALGVVTTYILRKKLNINSLKKEILKLDLNDSIRPEQFLGEGAEGAVYRIPNSNYVLKVPHIKYDITPQRGTKVDVSKLDFNVSKQDRINHIVASCGKAKIMTYIQGHDITSAPANLIDNLSISNIKKFFLDIDYAYKHKMCLDDVGGNNIKINPMNGELTIFDLWSGKGSPALLLSFQSMLCGNYKLTATQQNRAFQKGVIGLLELLGDKKINITKYRQYLDFGLSPSSFKDESFCEQVIKILREYKDSKINIHDCITKIQKLDPTANKGLY